MPKAALATTGQRDSSRPSPTMRAAAAGPPAGEQVQSPSFCRSSAFTA
jgi:hypothetical protein